MRGRDAIRAYWREATGDLKGVSVTFGVPVANGSRAAVEWWAILRTDDGTATLPGALILAFDENSYCKELREYWHLDEGHGISAPDGWGR